MRPAFAGPLDYVLAVLLALLVAGYVGINFAVDLPGFLVAENIALAVGYALALYLHVARSRGYVYAASLAWFNAGRVSRSVVTPEGQLAELALQHLPLLALVAATGLAAALKAVEEEPK